MTRRSWVTVTRREIEEAPQLQTWPMAAFLCLFVGTVLDARGRFAYCYSWDEDGITYICRWRWSHEFLEDHPWSRPNRHAWMPGRR